MAKKPLPTPSELRQLLRYEPETGKLYWLKRGPEWFEKARLRKTWNTRFAGREAGMRGPYGYPLVEVLGSTPIAAHRIIWALVYGRWPNEVDHIDGDRQNNLLENLREVSHAENMRNVKRPSHNTSGASGVSFNKRNGRWRAYITVEQRQRSLGHHETFEQALAARQRAEREYGFHENHGRP